MVEKYILVMKNNVARVGSSRSVFADSNSSAPEKGIHSLRALERLSSIRSARPVRGRAGLVFMAYASVGGVGLISISTY